MKPGNRHDSFSDPNILVAPSRFYPEAIDEALPLIDPGDQLEAFLAYDDGTLAEAPHALAAYIGHQRSRAS